MQAHGFRFSFTPIPWVLFTFPSRYWSPIGLQVVFSLAGWSPLFRPGFLVSRPTQVSARFRFRFRYGPFTLSGAPFQALPVASASARRGPYYPCAASTAQVWAKPLSLATTQGIDISFFSCGYLDVSVPRVRPRCSRVPALRTGGFPHSDTAGSIRACRSPALFAAFRVLHRLLKPRHPPCALSRFLREIAAPGPLRPCCFAIAFFCSRSLPLLSVPTSFNELPWRGRPARPVPAPQAARPLSLLEDSSSPTRLRPPRATSSKKEVFQPHLPVRLPCYDLAPVTCFALGRPSRLRTSGAPSSHGLTGGVYKARERIHRAMADARLLANPTSRSRVAGSDPNWDRLSGSASRRRVAPLCACHCNTCVAPDVRAVLI